MFISWLPSDLFAESPRHSGTPDHLASSPEPHRPWSTPAKAQTIHSDSDRPDADRSILLNEVREWRDGESQQRFLRLTERFPSRPRSRATGWDTLRPSRMNLDLPKTDEHVTEQPPDERPRRRFSAIRRANQGIRAVLTARTGTPETKKPLGNKGFSSNSMAVVGIEPTTHGL